ncbi:hypothetical protein CERZMDRAFT_111750 [Cercospora zeae-maydis SCOH1-5]|uniref:Uncharacterized protein n=1 Tax=Cercospora zeae-maydis SCOH1-5 TaxID=717836 RepID=A0A6A6FHG2_9PEZI|nr:hypothetical protein CERZMDRAFT_111750 [Cercospora zeae-maydis SCOH1-5]
MVAFFVSAYSTARQRLRLGRPNGSFRLAVFLIPASRASLVSVVRALVLPITTPRYLTSSMTMRQISFILIQRILDSHA